MTTPVPSASDSGRFRLGFFTSPAVNVTLFQASAENNEPTWATPNATNNPNAPLAAETVGMKDRKKFAPGSMGCAPRMAHKCVKLSEIAAAFRATNTQRKISPNKESVLALVNTF